MSFQAIAEDLLLATAASRTTVRVMRADGTFPIVAESLEMGVRSLKRADAVDPRAGATFRALEQERRMLIQQDVRRGVPSPPAELVAQYQVQAQMLAPIVHGDVLRGIVSVHECRSPREWSSDEVSALRRAAEAVRRVISGEKEERT